MTQFAADAFTGANDTELSAYSAAWSKFYTCNDAEIANNRVRADTATTSPGYKHSAVPPSADYEVSADIYCVSVSGTLNAGVCARITGSNNTCYWARYRNGSGWQLYRYNANTATQLGSTYAETLAAGDTRRIRLRVEGDVISVYRDAETTPIISVTDASPLTDAGSVGLLLNSTGSNGCHLDNFSADTLSGGGGGGDVTAPSAPGVPTFSSITKTGYRASWTAASDDVAVTGYEYNINGGSWIDAGNVLHVDVSGRTPGATDTVNVRAYDAAGNRGDPSSADQLLPIYGFRLSDGAGLEFGSIVGSLTGLGRETAGASWVAFVHDDATRALVMTSSAMTIDAAGRLSDLTNAALDATTYFVSFRRSDGAWAAARITAENLA